MQDSNVDLTPIEANLISAVAYYRMSSDDQEDSIPQQRREVVGFAVGKYRIVREYVDSGTSGSKDQEKRVEFRQMIQDSYSGEFQAILAWKTNRFARLDSLEGAEAKKVLRKNGVYLDTVKDGKIDWDTMGGRIVDAVRSEMDHAYSRGLASDSLRGRLAMLEKGHWSNGSFPYSYHRRYVGPDGREVLVKRTESFRKPEGWLLHLVICEEEAAIVRWIYEQIVTLDCSRRRIAEDLNRRGVPSPHTLATRGSGQSWHEKEIGRILTNPAYIGIGYLGVDGRSTRRGVFDRADNETKSGVCPVIVEPEIWEQTQRILAARVRQKRRPMRGTGALSGVLICGHCGYRMASRLLKGRLTYVCKTSMLRPGTTACACWQVYQDEILPAVCARLVETVDGEVLKALSARPPASERLGDLDMLRGRMADLERQIEQAAMRYLTAPADLMPTLEKSLQALRTEMSACEEKHQQLASAANESTIRNFVKWWEGVRSQLLLVPVQAGVPSYPGAATFWNATKDNAAPRPDDWRRVAGELWTDPAESPEAAEPEPEPVSVLVEPAALRSLLVRLGVTVSCFFEANPARARPSGKGSERKWFLARAVLTRKDTAESEITSGKDGETDALVSCYARQSALPLPAFCIDLIAAA